MRCGCAPVVHVACSEFHPVGRVDGGAEAVGVGLGSSGMDLPVEERTARDQKSFGHTDGYSVLCIVIERICVE